MAKYVRNFAFWSILFSAHSACGRYEDSVRRPPEASTASSQNKSPATADSKTSPQAAPIELPSQKAKFYVMPGEKPSEVCMNKGWTWLYKGLLVPLCSTCHSKGNKFGVNAFAHPDDEANAFNVFKASVNKEKFLAKAIDNSFCQTCTIKANDPVYADLKYFTTHDSLCEKP